MKTYGTRKTELVVTTANSEEVVLKQKFVVGEVHTSFLPVHLDHEAQGNVLPWDQTGAVSIRSIHAQGISGFL